MRIGIDISQIVYEGSGVSSYVKNLVRALVREDHENIYILFGSSFRQYRSLVNFYTSLPQSPRVKLVALRLPVRFFELLWNRLGIIPVEWIIGSVDIFWSSDWIQPPLSHAKGITTVHDVSFMKFPRTFPQYLIAVHTRRLKRALRICKKILCDSEATKKDIADIFHVSGDRLEVIYPGFTAL
jgi:glycosyltransferase involved in cell wall biosynthesis